jgi:hypothetical protein
MQKKSHEKVPLMYGFHAVATWEEKEARPFHDLRFSLVLA